MEETSTFAIWRGTPSLSLAAYNAWGLTNMTSEKSSKFWNKHREVNKGLYVVARNFFLLLLNCSAWPCLGPAWQVIDTNLYLHL